MGKYRVFVTRKIPKTGIDLLLEECEEVIVRSSEEAPTKRELIDGVKGRQALLSLLTDEVDCDVVEAGDELKIIANYAVGHNNIDVSAATRKGIMVTNTPGVLTETTADLAWTLLMGIARRLVEADSYARSGSFRRWEPTLLLGSDVFGKTLGIIGLGRIGRAMAARAAGFGMRVMYTDTVRADPDVEKTLAAEYTNLQDLLRTSDFVTLHTPLTPETHHLIGPNELGMMKPSSYLINTSRGPVVDENALTEALEKGKIAGAALDVFEEEPNIHPRLMKLSNVIITPHIGSGSVETRSKMANMAAGNIIAAMRGERPPNLVNPDVLG